MYIAKNKKWKARQKDVGTIGRVFTVHPTSGEMFYLQVLLHHEQSKGAQSFDDLRTVDGRLLPTFQAAYSALGILQKTANGIRHCKKQNTRSFVVKFVSSLLQCCCFVTLATRMNCLIAIISTGGTITRGKWNGQTDLKIKREVINFF